jgi:G:T-mismatch repair DNA endonuclease (very short patch repair protein)
LPERRGNVNRMECHRNSGLLELLEWRVLVVWECQLCDIERLRGWLLRFLRD